MQDMKRIQCFEARHALAAASLLAVMAACAQKDTDIDMPVGNGQPMAVEFSVSMEGQRTGTDGAGTRASEGLQNTVFAYTGSASTNTWSKVGVFHDNGNYSFTPTAYYTYADTPELTGDPFYYDLSQIACHMYAWYPYTAGSATHTIQAAQNTNENYVKSDLLITKVNMGASPQVPLPASTRARQPNNDWVQTKGNLVFSHAMTKIVVKLLINTGVTVSKIELLNIKRSVDIAVTGGEGTEVTAVGLGAAYDDTSEDDTDNSVVLYTSASASAYTDILGQTKQKSNGTLTSADGMVTLTAVIPPQTLTGDFIQVTTADGKVFLNLGDTGKTFAGGQTYTTEFYVTEAEVGYIIDMSGWDTSSGSCVIVLNEKTPNSITLNNGVYEIDITGTGSFIVTGYHGGLSVESSDSNIATATVSNGVVTVNAVGTGTAYLRVTDAGDESYEQAQANMVVNTRKSGGAANSLSDLKTKISLGDDNVSDYLGWYVDSSGNIHSSYVTNDIGRIAYISTDGSEVDTSVAGSRILVSALYDTYYGTSAVMNWSSESASTGYTDLDLMNGYEATVARYNLDFRVKADGSESPYYYPFYEIMTWKTQDADGAVVNGSDDGNGGTINLADGYGLVAAARSDTDAAQGHWFLPSKAQLAKCYAIIKYGSGLGDLASAWYWSSTEGYYNGVWHMSSSGGWRNDGFKRSDSYRARAVLAY